LAIVFRGENGNIVPEYSLFSHFGEIWRFFSEEKMGTLCQNIPFYFYSSHFGEISRQK
jgi:hypothetical protein